MRQDEIEITILEDGEIKVETSRISGANHMGADQLLKFLESQLGGKSVTTKRAATHVHGLQNTKITTGGK